MKALQVNGTWKPRDGYELTKKELAEKRAYNGFQAWHDPKIEIVEKPIPEPAADELLVKVGGCGVCGSDTRFLGKDEDGYILSASHLKLPCVVGHEFAGEVVKTGKDVKYFKVGDIAAGENMNWCGECRACKMGEFNYCEQLEEIGFTRDGGFAQYAVIKEKYCYNINGLINIYGNKQRAMEVGALLEPFAVAYNGLFISGGGFLPGGHAVVFGCGPIGLAVTALAKCAGAGSIIVFDLINERLELAKEMGAEYTFNPIELKEKGALPSEAILDVTDGVGASVFIEATENQNATLPEIEKSFTISSKVIQIGLSTEKVAISPKKFQIRGASFRGSYGNAGHGIFQMVVQLVASGRLDISKMLTKKYKFDNVIQALEDAKTGIGKYVVTPNI